jgi:hypothetical protein
MFRVIIRLLLLYLAIFSFFLRSSAMAMNSPVIFVRRFFGCFCAFLLLLAVWRLAVDPRSCLLEKIRNSHLGHNTDGKSNDNTPSAGYPKNAPGDH